MPRKTELSRSRSPLLSWAAVAALALPAFLLGFHRIDSSDIWIHLAAGRHIVETGSVPERDPFSPPDTAANWINTQWLADVVLFLLHRVGASAALVTWAAILGGVALVLPCALAMRRRVVRLWPYLVALLLAMIIAYERFFVRPELVSLLLLAAATQLLRQRGPRTRGVVLALVAVQIAWSNSHAASVLGPILALLAWLGDAVDRRLRRADGAAPPTRLPPALPFL
ncbi:MAG: hypothetical protein ACE5G2_09710, partial [Candidatus Krumholzibacteriia bacterium]